MNLNYGVRVMCSRSLECYHWPGEPPDHHHPSAITSPRLPYRTHIRSHMNMCICVCVYAAHAHAHARERVRGFEELTRLDIWARRRNDNKCIIYTIDTRKSILCSHPNRRSIPTLYHTIYQPFIHPFGTAIRDSWLLFVGVSWLLSSLTLTPRHKGGTRREKKVSQSWDRWNSGELVDGTHRGLERVWASKSISIFVADQLVLLNLPTSTCHLSHLEPTSEQCSSKPK